MPEQKKIPESKKFIKAAKELQELKDTLEICYDYIVEKKIQCNDRIGFEYQGRHYYFMRDL